jgi:DNA/RNA endonuclease YhcR with UshA esterase domain
MEEKTLSNIALISVIIGIISLFVISYFLDYKETEIGMIDGSYLGKNVKVIGEVGKFNDYGTLKTFIVKDNTGEIMVVVFTESLEVEGNVEIVGSVEDYKGSLEIIADKIEIIQ